MTLTIDFPAAIYRKLMERALSIGNSPEEMALRYVADAVADAESDPLLQLAGIFESDMNDIAENHDRYLGINQRS